MEELLKGRLHAQSFAIGKALRIACRNKQGRLDLIQSFREYADAVFKDIRNMAPQQTSELNFAQQAYVSGMMEEFERLAFIIEPRFEKKPTASDRSAL